MATVTQIPTLDREVRRHIRYCGLDQQFEYLRITLNYADNGITEEEFIHYFLTWTPEQQEESRRLLTEIGKTVMEELEKYS